MLCHDKNIAAHHNHALARVRVLLVCMCQGCATKLPMRSFKLMALLEKAPRKRGVFHQKIAKCCLGKIELLFEGF